MQSVSATFVFTFNLTGLIGNELRKTINLQLNVPEIDGNMDTNPSNNGLTLTLEPTAIADISISSL